MKSIVLLAVSVLSVLSFTASTAVHASSDRLMYEVTITNLTKGQQFTPTCTSTPASTSSET